MTLKFKLIMNFARELVKINNKLNELNVDIKRHANFQFQINLMTWMSDHKSLMNED